MAKVIGVDVSAEQRSLIETALYVKAVVARTSWTISRGPNGREASVRYLMGAMQAADNIVAELTHEAAEIGRRNTQTETS